MRLLELIRQFLDDVAAQRLRTTLTILGITWGTVAVVVLLAFGTGLEKHMKTQAKGMGDGISIVFPGRTTRAYQGFGEGRAISLLAGDADLLAREIPEITAISPEYGRWLPARRGTSITNAYVTGVVPVYGEMRNIIPEPGGRFLNPIDVAQRRRVAVLGDQVKRTLFGDEDAVGKSIFIGDTPFLVVGVMQEKTQSSSYNARDHSRIFIPASTHEALLGSRYLSNLVYKAASPAVAERFTLTVGGIGVANIMYIVVRERTREIGIKRSVGARRRDIMLQFLFEATLLVAAGALFGLIVSYGLVALVGMLPIEEHVGRAEISSSVLIATIPLLGAIAGLAGWFP